MDFRGTYKWNFSNLTKISESRRSQVSGAFLRFSKFSNVGALAGKVVALCMTCKGT
jgi:hypothetical protein